MLPRVKILDSEFFVDHQRKELRHRANPDNKVPFRALEKEMDPMLYGYPMLYDKDTKKLHAVDVPKNSISKNFEYVLLPEVSYVSHPNEVMPAFAIGVSQDDYFVRLQRHNSTIRLANTDFKFEQESGLLKEVGRPSNAIPLHHLKYDESKGGYPLLFDKITRNIYRGFLPENGLPPMTEQVVIPATGKIKAWQKQRIESNTTTQQKAPEPISPKRSHGQGKKI